MKRNPWHWLLSLALSMLVSSTSAGEPLEAFTEPYHRVALPAPEIGVISEILVEEGDAISQKQVLAKLDDTVLQASLEVAKSAKDALGAIRNAEIELSLREKQVNSYRELLQQGNATQRELERAESEFQQASARLQSVREDLEVRRLEYERVKAQIKQRSLESPIDGFVTTIEKSVGEFVSPTDPIVMHIVHLKTLKAVFSVPLGTTHHLRAGQTVMLSLGNDRSSLSTGSLARQESVAVPGVIEAVSPVADAESGTVRVKVRIPNGESKFQSGVACRWSVEVESPVEKTTRSRGSSRR